MSSTSSSRELKLVSPVGAEAYYFEWPLAAFDGREGATEILETIKWVTKDIPQLDVALSRNKVLEDLDFNDFDCIEELCGKYNRTMESLRKMWKGTTTIPKTFNQRPSTSHLRHIINQAYQRSVTDPSRLNGYEPFSPSVYGETSFDFVTKLCTLLDFNETSTFIDMGSGVGQVVMQVAAATKCANVYGVEKADWPARYAQKMDKEFRRWMAWYGKTYSPYELVKDDFLKPKWTKLMLTCDFVFVNNFAFGPVLDLELKRKFQELKDGAKIISSKPFCALNFKITDRNLNELGAIMRVEPLDPQPNAVSWTCKEFSYYLHTIDQARLERYYLNNRKDDSEDKSLRDRKGRPLEKHRAKQIDRSARSSSTSRSSSDSSVSSLKQPAATKRPAVDSLKVESIKIIKSDNNLEIVKQLQEVSPMKLSLTASSSSATADQSANTLDKSIESIRADHEPDLIDNVFDTLKQSVRSFMDDQVKSVEYSRSSSDSLCTERAKNKALKDEIESILQTIQVLRKHNVELLSVRLLEVGVSFKVHSKGAFTDLLKSATQKGIQLKQQRDDLIRQIRNLPQTPTKSLPLPQMGRGVTQFPSSSSNEHDSPAEVRSKVDNIMAKLLPQSSAAATPTTRAGIQTTSSHGGSLKRSATTPPLGRATVIPNPKQPNSSITSSANMFHPTADWSMLHNSLSFQPPAAAAAIYPPVALNIPSFMYLHNLQSLIPRVPAPDIRPTSVTPRMPNILASPPLRFDGSPSMSKMKSPPARFAPEFGGNQNKKQTKKQQASTTCMVSTPSTCAVPLSGLVMPAPAPPTSSNIAPSFAEQIAAVSNFNILKPTPSLSKCLSAGIDDAGFVPSASSPFGPMPPVQAMPVEATSSNEETFEKHFKKKQIRKFKPTSPTLTASGSQRPASASISPKSIQDDKFESSTASAGDDKVAGKTAAP